jgi:hypothetical protein
MQIFFVALRLYFGSWSPLTGFAITLTVHTTLRRTPLDEWSARRRNLYLTTHNAHKRQTSMPPPVFEPTIPTGEWPQTHTLGQTATAIGEYLLVQSDCTRKRLLTQVFAACALNRSSNVLQNLAVIQVVSITQNFLEPECLLPCSQGSTTCPYSETN